MSAIIRYRGNTAELTLAVTNAATGAARNLTGETLTIKLSQVAGQTAILSKALTITDAANGLATVELTAAETANLNGAYVYAITLTTAASKVYTVDYGSLSITNTPQ